MSRPVFDSRRAVRVLEPALQLRLPFYLMLATAVFVAAFAWNGWAAFRRLAELTLADSPDVFVGTLWEQARAFLIVSGAMLVGYLALVSGVCLAFTHRMIGPRIAITRQIEALKNGSYGSRVRLRRHEVVFRELARELNDLAQILEHSEKRSQRPARPESVVATPQSEFGSPLQ
ncbi:MAG: hypothetical protein QNK04_04665 [Myxococcota bacterium]|nr:hypothetical protein [Myxococcota bacterium]